MDKEKYREANSVLGIENMRKGYRIFGSEEFKFSTALRVQEQDEIKEMFDIGKSNREIVKEKNKPLRTVQDHRKKYYGSQKKKPGK
jgi:hypothetical protein